MAVVNGFVSASMPSLEVWFGSLLRADATTIILADAQGRRTEYTGSFTYNSFGVDGGTLTGIKEYRDNELIYSATGGNADAVDMYEAIQIQANFLRAASIFLEGDDTMNGSAENDTIVSFSGDDVVNGGSGDDDIRAGDGNDTIDGGAGADTITGFDGTDTAIVGAAFAAAQITEGMLGNTPFVEITVAGVTDRYFEIENFEFTDQTVSVQNLTPVPGENLTGTAGDDLLVGNSGPDMLVGLGGDDTLQGQDGPDTLNGGDGNDEIIGGLTSDDRRDVVYAGAGNDSVDGGAGNDELNGGDGNDTMEGGAGADTVIGNAGDDVLTGSAFSDLVFGGGGSDFVNGGFGSDRVNGGTGADRFFHVGIADHGSDWIQDYSAGEGDVLVYGGSAVASQFQVNFTETANAGQAGVEEAFVIFRPTGQILWALVDGGAQSEIMLRLTTGDVDLLA